MGNGALAHVLWVDAELLVQFQALDLIASPLAQLEFQDGNAVLHHAAVVVEAAAHATSFRCCRREAASLNSLPMISVITSPTGTDDWK